MADEDRKLPKGPADTDNEDAPDVRNDVVNEPPPPETNSDAEAPAGVEP